MSETPRDVMRYHLSDGTLGAINFWSEDTAAAYRRTGTIYVSEKAYNEVEDQLAAVTAERNSLLEVAKHKGSPDLILALGKELLLVAKQRDAMRKAFRDSDSIAFTDRVPIDYANGFQDALGQLRPHFEEPK